MIDEIADLVQAHSQWLKDKTVIKNIPESEWVEITTPYLDRHNDQLQILIRKSEGNFELTDGGYILADLELSGCSFESKKRHALLHSTLNAFGVRNDNGVFSVVATKGNFPLKKHCLVQAMLSVNDLFIAAAPTVASLFSEDVKRWLDENEIRYTNDLSLQGKSGLTHRFEFIIPHSREQPERVIQLMNRPSRQGAIGAIFRWIDTKDSREQNAQGITFLNDEETKVKSSFVTTLQQYSLTPIIWSKRADFLNYLKA